MTTTWKIFDTQYQTADGLITKVVYACTVQLESCIDRKVGELLLTGTVQIPYEDLTEEVVLGWVKASLGSKQVLAIETALQENVNTQKAQKDAITEKNGLPWRNL